MRVLGGLNGSGDYSIQILVGWRSQRPAGLLDWVFLAFELLSQSLTRYVLHKFGADLELASCCSPCWINVLFSWNSNMKYIKSKLKTGQCFPSNAMGIFVFKSSFSTPQIFPTSIFFNAETIFPSVKGLFFPFLKSWFIQKFTWRKWTQIPHKWNFIF